MPLRRRCGRRRDPRPV